VATEGTAAALAAEGLDVAPVSDLAGAPSMLGGRLKTLHAPIFAGLLYRRGNPEDEAEIADHGLPRVDLLACNFHRVADRTASAGALLQDVDIGGPAMVRAAAKNFASVLVVTDPEDYAEVVDALTSAAGDPAGVAAELRQRLALKAFALTRDYDATIVDRLRAGEGC
jgi:AICAR transformylase/IMP cyclohydrolase PurH